MGFLFGEKGENMIKVIKNQGVSNRPRVLKHPVKLTALLYLKEALLKERYEVCASIITTAKEFGAANFEIQDLLEDPRRSPS